MIVEIPSQPGDDRRFRVSVNGLLARLVSAYEPERAFAIRLNKWFDHKWLGYSGKGRVSFRGDRESLDTALDEHFQTKLTLPPFNPKQVVGECHWRRNRDLTYSRLVPP